LTDETRRNAPSSSSTASCRRTPAERCSSPSPSSSPTLRARRRSAAPRTLPDTASSEPVELLDQAACRPRPPPRRWRLPRTSHRRAGLGLCPTLATRNTPATGSGKLSFIERMNDFYFHPTRLLVRYCFWCRVSLFLVNNVVGKRLLPVLRSCNFQHTWA